MKRKTFLKQLYKFAREFGPEAVTFVSAFDRRPNQPRGEEKIKKPRRLTRQKSQYEVPKVFTKETYAQYLETALWRGIRDKVLKLKGKKCEGCESETHIQVHHSVYKPSIMSGKSLRGLRVVCKTCHEKIHALKGITLQRATMQILDSKPIVYNPTIKIYKSTTNEVETLKKMAKKIKY